MIKSRAPGEVHLAKSGGRTSDYRSEGNTALKNQTVLTTFTQSAFGRFLPVERGRERPMVVASKASEVLRQCIDLKPEGTRNASDYGPPNSVGSSGTVVASSAKAFAELASSSRESQATANSDAGFLCLMVMIIAAAKKHSTPAVKNAGR